MQVNLKTTSPASRAEETLNQHLKQRRLHSHNATRSKPQSQRQCVAAALPPKKRRNTEVQKLADALASINTTDTKTSPFLPPLENFILNNDPSEELDNEDDEVLDEADVEWVTPEAEAQAELAMLEQGDAGDEYWEEYDDDDDWDYDDVKDKNKPRKAGKRLPADVRCFDTARIYVKGGDGGRGCVAFRREKYVPKGGPSGGNGGNGGAVWVEADQALNSLMVFRRQVHFRADPGSPGLGSDMHGANAKELVIKVPPGTIIRNKDAGEDSKPIAEVLKDGDRALLAVGGRGGRGNLAFKSSRNNAPAMAEFGEKGQELWLDLELKLVADVGIIGVPNAGKSTLLSVLSAARPKVADYPFTTLVPNLGVCAMDYRTTVFADVPGLLEGAHAGIGLGHQFLRHCQRCRVLVHVIDGTSPDPVGDFDAIRQELALFNPELADKPQVVAYNKMDVPDSSDYWEDVQAQLQQRGVELENIYAISAAAGTGVIELVRRVRAVLDALPEEEQIDEESLSAAQRENELVVVNRAKAASKIGEFTITKDLSGPRVWFVKGDAIERFAQMTDWSYYEAAKRFQGVLDASGISKALKKQGILEGDTVVIGEMQFEHSDDTSDGSLFDRWYQARREAGLTNKGSARWPHATR